MAVFIPFHNALHGSESVKELPSKHLLCTCFEWGEYEAIFCEHFEIQRFLLWHFFLLQT